MAKLIDTVRICATLFMARTFGRYEHSVWDGQRDYARYAWRGKVWAFPTSPIDQPNWRADAMLSARNKEQGE